MRPRQQQHIPVQQTSDHSGTALPSAADPSPQVLVRSQGRRGLFWWTPATRRPLQSIPAENSLPVMTASSTSDMASLAPAPAPLQPAVTENLRPPVIRPARATPPSPDHLLPPAHAADAAHAQSLGPVPSLAQKTEPRSESAPIAVSIHGVSADAAVPRPQDVEVPAAPVSAAEASSSVASADEHQATSANLPGPSVSHAGAAPHSPAVPAAVPALQVLESPSVPQAAAHVQGNPRHSDQAGEAAAIHMVQATGTFYREGCCMLYL